MKRWPMATLGEIAGGGQYGLNAPAMSEGTGVRFVRITDITQAGELRHGEPAFVPVDTPELDNYELKDGDVLIARSGATAGKSYVHHSFGTRTVFAGYLIRFRPDTSKVLPRFVGAFLQTPAYWQQLNSHKRAVAQPNVNAKQLASLVLPMPPLAEQERIVKLLDEADELRKLRAQADSRTVGLIPALFQEIFGDPDENPKGLPVLPFGELLAEPLRNGLSPAKDGSYPAKVFTLSAITGEEFDSAALKEASFARLPDRTCQTTEHLFLICRGNGNRELVGCGKFPQRLTINTVFPDTMIAAVPNPDRLLPAFLEAAWKQPTTRSQIRSNARTTNGTFKINQTAIEQIRLPVPPLPLQEEFAARVSEIRAMQAEQAASRRRLDDLFQSMLHRAFQGEL